MKAKNRKEKLIKKSKKKGKVRLFLRTFFSVIASFIIPIIESKANNKSNNCRLLSPNFMVGKSKTMPNKNSQPREKLLEKIKIEAKSTATKTVAKIFSVKTRFKIVIISPMKRGKMAFSEKLSDNHFFISEI